MMDAQQKKVQLAFTVFGGLVFIFNIWEFIVERLPRKEMTVILIECLAGIALIYLPQIFKKVLKLEIPKATVYFYWFFLLISVFIGTCLHVIRFLNGWDKVLHTVSPMVLTALGYGLIAMFLKKAKIEDTSPWLFLLFGFAFAGLCGVFWEFWEFLCDQFFNMNLQRYLDSPDSSGAPLIGRAALMDTMGDLFTNTLGAFIMLVFAAIHGKGKPAYFESYEIKKVK